MQKKKQACGIPPFEPPGVDPLSYRVFLAFMRAMHLHRQLMSKTFAHTGGHLGQAGALRILAVSDGMSQRDLAEKMHLSRPTVTTMLQAMESHGVIERRPDDKDQRVTRVYLTAEGRKVEEQVRSVLADYINETIGTMPKTDREDLERLLGNLGENTSKALEE